VINKAKCCRIAFNRLKRRGGFILFDSSFGWMTEDGQYFEDSIKEPNMIENPHIATGIGATAVAMGNNRLLYLMGGWIEDQDQTINFVEY